MNHPEQEFQIQAARLIRLQYPQAVLMAFSNGGYVMSARTVALLKAMGLEPGAPDWALVWPGGIGFIEFKAPKGTLSAVQKAVHARLKTAGARLAVVRDADALIATLAAWGVPKGPARAAA